MKIPRFRHRQALKVLALCVLGVCAVLILGRLPFTTAAANSTGDVPCHPVPQHTCCVAGTSDELTLVADRRINSPHYSVDCSGGEPPQEAVADLGDSVLWALQWLFLTACALRRKPKKASTRPGEGQRIPPPAQCRLDAVHAAPAIHLLHCVNRN